jgi:RNA polymerase sigma-70 factor, ECF subfamily
MPAELATSGPMMDRASDGEIDPLSDAGLVSRIIEGSQDALANAYDKHGNAVFAAAIRAGADRSVAAEVVQETFLALWNRAEVFDPSRGSLTTWLLAIARNRAIDRLRAAGRHDRAATFSSFETAQADDQSIGEWLTTSGMLIAAGGPEATPEHALSSKESRASIRAAVASLPSSERAVITLAYEAELSQPEIAARLGWPLGTVKTRTRRALRHLRELLERPGAGFPSSDATVVAGLASTPPKAATSLCCLTS